MWQAIKTGMNYVSNFSVMVMGGLVCARFVAGYGDQFPYFVFGFLASYKLVLLLK